MPEFYMIPQSEQNVVEVQITRGPDPVILYCDQETADRLIDARKVEALVQQNMPKIFEYNAKLELFLFRLAEVWPMASPPSWQDLADIMNKCEMFTPNGTHWTKHNLMQKLNTITFDKDTLRNPNGDVGNFFKPTEIGHETKLLDELVEDRGGVVVPDDVKVVESNPFANIDDPY